MQHPPIPRRALTAAYRIGYRVRRHFPRWHCYDSLRRDHVPLYSEEKQLAVLFSPKAGCTFAVKWFYFQTGILEEALAYSPWPHDYRLQVLYQQPGYREQGDCRAVAWLEGRQVRPRSLRSGRQRVPPLRASVAAPRGGSGQGHRRRYQRHTWDGMSLLDPRSPSANGSATSRPSISIPPTLTSGARSVPASGSADCHVCGS